MGFIQRFLFDALHVPHETKDVSFRHINMHKHNQMDMWTCTEKTNEVYCT